MEKKGNETTKTIIAVVLFVAAGFLVYWQLFRPEKTDQTQELEKVQQPYMVPDEEEKAGEGDALAGAGMPDVAAVFSEEPLGGGDVVGTLAAGASFVMHGEKYVPGLPGEEPVKLPTHAELAPGDYFSTERYYEVEEDEEKFIYSVKNADKFASGKLGDEGDKAFAGGAYFTSIDEMDGLNEMKNPFQPIIEEKEVGTASSIGTGTSTTTTGGGVFPTGGIWDDFGNIPWNDERTPPLNGGENGGGQGAFPPDYGEGSLEIEGGIVKVKGIALSSKGASALLEINYQGEQMIIRVRTGQVLEGRYQVADIQRNKVVVLDNLTGQTFELELKLGNRMSV